MRAGVGRMLGDGSAAVGEWARFGPRLGEISRSGPLLMLWRWGGRRPRREAPQAVARGPAACARAAGALNQ